MSTIVQLMVHMDCLGCEKKLMKALQKLDGVEHVEIDMDMQKVTVTGWADQEKLLKMVKRNGREAELWPFQYNADYHDFNTYYNFDQYRYQSNFTGYSLSEAVYNPTDNYFEHVYNVHENNYYCQPSQSSTIFNQPAIALFSDENTSACSIM